MRWLCMALGWCVLFTGSSFAGTAGAPVSVSAPQSGLPRYQAWVITDSEMIPIKVEGADTPERRTIGMMFRKNIPPNHGMYFFMPAEEPATFWMRNCYVPLDLVFLDRKGAIVNIVPSAPPCPEGPEDACPRFHSRGSVTHVLEMEGGWCESHGVKAGHKVNLGPRIYAASEPDSSVKGK